VGLPSVSKKTVKMIGSAGEAILVIKKNRVIPSTWPTLSFWKKIGWEIHRIGELIKWRMT